MKLDEFSTARAAQAASAGIDADPNEITKAEPCSLLPGSRRPRLNRFAALVVVVVSALLPGHAAVAQPDAGVYYLIKNISSKKVLALGDGAGKENGVQIIQREPLANERQQWTFVRMGGFYKILNRKTGMALTVLDGSKEERAPITQWDANDGGENQQWSIKKVGENFVFTARHSGMVIDVDGGSTERKAPVIQFPYHDAPNQMFELVPARE